MCITVGSGTSSARGIGSNGEYFGSLMRASQGVDRHSEHRCEMSDEHVLVALVGDVLAIDGDDVRQTVVGQHASFAVEDATAHGGDAHHPLPVRLRGDGQGRCRHDLEEPEAGEEGGEQADDNDPEHTHPQMGGVARHAVPAQTARRAAGFLRPTASLESALRGRPAGSQCSCQRQACTWCRASSANTQRITRITGGTSRAFSTDTTADH